VLLPAVLKSEMIKYGSVTESLKMVLKNKADKLSFGTENVQ